MKSTEINNNSFPIRMWVARYKDGHLILTLNKPTKLGDYYIDETFPAIPLPSEYFPEVTFTSGPKQVTYIQKMKSPAV